jgi:hypothetical protein
MTRACPRLRSPAAVALALAAAACAHQAGLVPAPGAQVEPGRPLTAEETVAGVRVQVDAGAWRGERRNDVLAPVRVDLTNGSGRPLRVTYAAFSLGNPHGFRLAALPPFQVAAQNATAVANPAFVGGGFLVAPWHARFYPHLGVWSGPLAFDAPYYDQWYPAWPSVPDQEVLRQALPEGVLEPGGHAQGFLYFRREKPGAAVEFLASLVDAATGQTFGTISIPFTVR